MGLCVGPDDMFLALRGLRTMAVRLAAHYAAGLKVAVVGGGSTYTPELVEGLALRAYTLPIDELVLLDIDAERLAIVGGLAGRMLRRLGWGGRLVLSSNRAVALDSVCDASVSG